MILASGRRPHVRALYVGLVITERVCFRSSYTRYACKCLMLLEEDHYYINKQLNQRVVYITVPFKPDLLII